MLEFGSDCIVSLDSQITLDHLKLSTSDFEELLSNFRKQNCRGEDALVEDKLRSDVYSKTAGQVRPSLLRSDTLRCPRRMKEVYTTIKADFALAILKVRLVNRNCVGCRLGSSLSYWILPQGNRRKCRLNLVPLTRQFGEQHLKLAVICLSEKVIAGSSPGHCSLTSAAWFLRALNKHNAVVAAGSAWSRAGCQDPCY